MTVWQSTMEPCLNKYFWYTYNSPKRDWNDAVDQELLGGKSVSNLCHGCCAHVALLKLCMWKRAQRERHASKHELVISFLSTALLCHILTPGSKHLGMFKKSMTCLLNSSCSCFFRSFCAAFCQVAAFFASVVKNVKKPIRKSAKHLQSHFHQKVGTISVLFPRDYALLAKQHFWLLCCISCFETLASPAEYCVFCLRNKRRSVVVVQGVERQFPQQINLETTFSAQAMHKFSSVVAWRLRISFFSAACLKQAKH